MTQLLKTLLDSATLHSGYGANPNYCYVIPAQAGIQGLVRGSKMDSRLRGNDDSCSPGAAQRNPGKVTQLPKTLLDSAASRLQSQPELLPHHSRLRGNDVAGKYKLGLAVA